MKDTISIELIIAPLTFISWAILSVKKSTLTIHLVIFKFTFIIGTVLEKKFSFSMFLSIEHCSFITSAIFKGLYCVNKFIFVFLHHGMWLTMSLNTDSFFILNYGGNIAKITDRFISLFCFSVKFFNRVKNCLSLWIHKCVF